jgi:hypothetical protein
MRATRLVVVIALVMLAGCSSGGSGTSAPPSTAANGFAATEGVPANKFACLDFLVKVTSGPHAGKTVGGDLILTTDSGGAFAGDLVNVGDADRTTLTIRNGAEVLCTAVGQVNSAQVTWILHCKDGSRIFGTGLVDQVGGQQELRGVTGGPDDADTGVYHGRNYPPYIRIISPSFN